MVDAQERFQDAVARGVAEGVRRSQEQTAQQRAQANAAGCLAALAALAVAGAGGVLFAATSRGWFVWASIPCGTIAFMLVLRQQRRDQHYG